MRDSRESANKIKKMTTKILPTLHFNKEIIPQEIGVIIAGRKDIFSRNVVINPGTVLQKNPWRTVSRTGCISTAERRGTGSSNANFGSIKSRAAKRQIWQGPPALIVRRRKHMTVQPGR